jgi:hypothetical protein
MNETQMMRDSCAIARTLGIWLKDELVGYLGGSLVGERRVLIPLHGNFGNCGAPCHVAF